jgi:homoserine kinase
MDGVKVRVPATTANLGPGFDCLGLALTLYNRLEAHECDELRIETEGEGASSIPRDASNLAHRAMRRAYEAAGRACPGLFMRQVNAIPLAAGLGSSAAAVVGGLVAANALMGNPIDKRQLLEIAFSMEGHPDNAAPCLFGGLTVAVAEGCEVYYACTQPDARFCFAAMTPDFELPTKKARQALPDSYPRKDAVGNVGRAVLMYAALEQGRGDLLRAACSDALHQPYRKALIPGFDDVNACAEDAGALASFLSGAGPTVMAVFDRADEGFMQRLAEGLKGIEGNWKTMRLECCQEGATVRHGG